MRRVASYFAANGGTATANCLGVDAKTVTAWVEDWVCEKRIPNGMPPVPFVRRARKSSTIMIYDTATGTLVGIVRADRDGMREVAEAAKLDRTESILIEFDVEMFEALAEAGIRAAIHPDTARSYLFQVLDGANESMECALIAEDIAKSGWNAGSIAMLRSAAPSRARLKIDMWTEAILDGLETYEAAQADIADVIDARCSPLRMMAICIVMLTEMDGNVAAKEIVSALKRAGLAEDGVPIARQHF